MIVCLYEDRPHCVIGLKLALLSLARHCPDLRLTVGCPRAPGEFRRWIARLPGVDLRDEEDLGAKGWDVKPALLLRLLSEGHDDIVWIDDDIIATGPLPSPLHQSSSATCVLAEESYWGGRQRTDRTAAWGLRRGRWLPGTVNTAVVRVTPRHADLLKAWQALLGDPHYRSAQAQPWYERLPHLMGDQDVLEALLSSEDFADVPVAILRRGVDIAQCHTPSGYTPLERLRTMASYAGQPALLHAQGDKPWDVAGPPVLGDGSPRERLRAYYSRLHLELSPYTRAAYDYRDEIGEEAPWLDPKTRGGRAVAALLRHHGVMQEFPLAVLHSCGRHATHLLKR
jgi:hypothetical protein